MDKTRTEYIGGMITGLGMGIVISTFIFMPANIEASRTKNWIWTAIGLILWGIGAVIVTKNRRKR